MKLFQVIMKFLTLRQNQINQQLISDLSQKINDFQSNQNFLIKWIDEQERTLAFHEEILSLDLGSYTDLHRGKFEDEERKIGELPSLQKKTESKPN